MPDHYTRLLEWRREESAARGLHKLPHDFYAATQAYLAELRTTFESELRQNPSGKKGDLARQMHQRAVQIARDIVEARTMKILTLAFHASAGSQRETTNALPEERALYERLLEGLRRHRLDVAPFLESGGGAVPAALAAPTPAAAAPDTSPSARRAMVTVRILKDAPPIELGTGPIELRREDVLDLPAETARLLIQAHVAERIGPSGPSAVT